MKLELEAGGWRLEAGGWRLEAGSWRLEAGGWWLEAGGWRLAAADWRVKVAGEKLENLKVRLSVAEDSLRLDTARLVRHDYFTNIVMSWYNMTYEHYSTDSRAATAGSVTSCVMCQHACARLHVSIGRLDHACEIRSSKRVGRILRSFSFFIVVASFRGLRVASFRSGLWAVLAASGPAGAQELLAG